MKFENIEQLKEHFDCYVDGEVLDINSVREFFLSEGKKIEDSELGSRGFEFYTNRQCTKVFEENFGDGNEMEVVFKFTDPEDPENYIYLSFDGYYSSWDSSSYETVSLVEPYEHTETRYKIMN